MGEGEAVGERVGLEGADDVEVGGAGGGEEGGEEGGGVGGEVAEEVEGEGDWEREREGEVGGVGEGFFDGGREREEGVVRGVRVHSGLVAQE